MAKTVVRVHTHTSNFIEITKGIKAFINDTKNRYMADYVK